MAKLVHEHFCADCYGPSYVKGVSRGSSMGWWKCADQPCVFPQTVRCKKHHDAALVRLGITPPSNEDAGKTDAAAR